MLRRLPISRSVRGLIETIVTLAVALVLAFAVQAYAVKPYRIPSASMYPTLKVGQRVLVDRASHRLGATPKVGQITVFHPPADAEDQQCSVPHQGASTSSVSCSTAESKTIDATWVKRIVAGPGDTIAVRNGHVIRNGKLVDEPYAQPCSGEACNLAAVRVPAGHWFMMGDNRGDSDDSRYWGAVPTSAIIGRAMASYWPPRAIGSL